MSLIKEHYQDENGNWLPEAQEILAKATATLARTPSLDDIVDRAYGLVLDAVGARLRAVPVRVRA